MLQQNLEPTKKQHLHLGMDEDSSNWLVQYGSIWFNMVQYGSMVEWLNMVESSESKRMVKICKSQGFFDQLPFVLVRLLRPSPYAKNVRVRQREGQGRCFQEGQTGVLALRRRY